MAVEIEKPSVSFTNEAEIALSRSVEQLERSIRAKAANIAIKSRGTPSEVTGSDVEKARELLMQPVGPVHYKPLYEQSWKAPRTRMLSLLSSFYQWLGLVVAGGGLLYPFIHERLANPTFRVGVVIAFTGLVTSFFGWFMKQYIRMRELARRDAFQAISIFQPRIVKTEEIDED